MGILNLTRKIIPKIGPDKIKNIEAIHNLPEMVLTNMLNKGNQNILHVDMNQCAAAIIKQSGVSTVFTDSLGGCNAVGLIAKTTTGEPLAILSHYVPTATSNQVVALSKQLETYSPYLDKTYKPKLFFNTRAIKTAEGELISPPNLIYEKVKALISKFFPQGVETYSELYPTNSRGAFYSSANIFQFDPENLNKLKITFVGEKEKFLDLKI